MNNEYQLNDLENFNLSDSDSDSDNELNQNLLNEHKDFFDNLQLQYFPEPYNSVGQFVLSATVGVLMMYINKSRNNVDNTGVLSYNEYLDTYFTYCNNTSSDSYLNELLEKINLIDYNSLKEGNSESIEYRNKILKLLDSLKKYSKEIVGQLFENNIDTLNEYIAMPDSEFKLDSVSVTLIQLLVPLIKFTKLMEIY
jgi:hypothetical protein